MIVVIFVAIMAIIVLYFVLHHYSVEIRRNQAKKKPTPDNWEASLNSSYDWFSRLSDNEKEKLFGHMKVFLTEKAFFDRKGAPLDETFKVLTAAEACLPLIHRKTNYYGLIDSIYVDKDKTSALGGPLCFTSKDQPIDWLEILHAQFDKEMPQFRQKVERLGFLHVAENFFRAPETLKEEAPEAYTAISRFFGHQG